MSAADQARSSERRFVRRTLIVIAIAGLAILLWELRSLILLVFGAVLVAVILRALANPIHRVTRLPDGLAVAAAVLLLVGVVFGAAWLLGSQVAGQVRTLIDVLPDAWRSLEIRLGDMWFGDRLQEMITDAAPSGSGVLSSASRFILSFGSGLADTLVVLAGGIYLAAQPGQYSRGALKLVPPQRRELAEEAMESSGRALRLWLKGQLVSMVLVGMITGLGLWLIGIPSALALGLLAALLEFIPILGPIIAAIPGLLLALALGTDTALWALALYVGIQQIEGNVVQPIVQQYAVELPPVLLLFALLGFASLFGALGVILAAPLTVVAYVLVKRLYVQEALRTPTSIPGSD